MTVATIISRISGIPFAEYVQSRIFDRLPFGSATYNTTRVKESGHLAEGFARVKRGVGTQAGGEGWSKSVYKPVPLFIGEEGEEDIFAGAGGVFMSGRDTVRTTSPFLTLMLLLILSNLFTGYMAPNPPPRRPPSRNERGDHPSRSTPPSGIEYHRRSLDAQVSRGQYFGVWRWAGDVRVSGA